MQANHDDLIGLINLQQIDLELRRQRKEFEELPQRQAILDARERRSSVEQKQAKVAELKKAASSRLARIEGEDAVLSRKAAEVQEAIDAAGGDYRNVEARTKELAGIAKRRATLEEEHAKADADLSKIADVEAQISQALAQIDAAEARAIASFQKEGGALRDAMAEFEARRRAVAGEIDAALIELYDKTAARAGGVAIGRLRDGRCGVCRATIEGGRLIDLKAQAPLGVCPSCRRLLVIE